MKNLLLNILIFLFSSTAYGGNFINVYSTDDCQDKTGIAIIPIGSKINCQALHEISLDRSRAWAVKVAGLEASECINISDTTVFAVCKAYNLE